jgi:dTDP-4-amino-4,6-dideoxygalactose transaminase
MITTNDQRLADRCRLLRNFGDHGKFNWDSPGFNFRLNEVAAAIGLCQLAKLDEIVARRRAKARRYDDGFAGCDLIYIPRVRGPQDSNYQLYTIRLALDRLSIDRDRVIALLADRGISTRLYYPALHRQGVFAQFGAFKDADFPAAMEFERSALSLPIFTSLTVEEQNYVIASLMDILTTHAK